MPEDQAPWFEAGGLAGLLNLLDQFRSDGGGQDGAGFVGPVAQGHEIQEPFLVELVNSRMAWKRTRSGNSSSGAGGKRSWRNSMFVRPMATRVSKRPRPRAPRAAASRAPISTSDLSAPGSRGRNSTANACSMSTWSPREEATARRASEPFHSRARSWGILKGFRVQGSGFIG